MGGDNVFSVVGIQGRCLRTFPGGTATAAGAILIAAATFGTWQPGHYPLSVPGLQISAESGPALIAFEIFLGLWLISGALPTAARKVAIGCFSAFACYTLYEALAGKTDCGCFGQVHVNPWFTIVLDISIVLGLVFLAKPPATPSRWSKRKWPVAVAAGIGLAVGVAAAALHPNPAIVANGLATADSGKLVILEPHKWRGHRLAVLADIVPRGTATPTTCWPLTVCGCTNPAPADTWSIFPSGTTTTSTRCTCPP
jgi:hypothetical protein